MGAYYPSISIRTGETGSLTARFFVGPDGKVSNVIIDRPSGHPRIDDATIDMLKSGWHFTPATLPRGENVGTWFRSAFVWTLRGDRSKDDDGCFAPDGTSSADMVIAACTQFLTNPNLTNYQRALAFESRGSAHRSKREFDQAIVDYDSGIGISPGLSGLHIGRARAHLAKGEAGLAFSDFDSGVYVEPLNFVSYIARAEAYFKAGQQDRAAADLDSAMRVTSTSYQAYARCLYFTRIGKPQDGLVECNKAVTLLPRESQNLNNRGITYLKLGQYERAIQDYDAALRINARLAPSLYGRGVAKQKRGDAKGESDLKAARAIDPMIGEQMAEIGVMP
jgi:TonB family protein